MSRFNPHRFNRLLNNVGQKFIWRAASKCPCVDPHSGAARPGCPNCKGKGKFWRAGVRAVAGVAGQRSQKEWAAFGNYETGDLVLVIPENSPMYCMGQDDRVTMLNGTDRFSSVFTRGDDDAFLPPIKRVDRVFWLDSSSEVIEGELPTVDEDGAITWLSGAPPAGTKYTIEGERFMEYYCFGAHPSDRNQHSGMRLPRKAILRRFDVFNR